MRRWNVLTTVIVLGSALQSAEAAILWQEKWEGTQAQINANWFASSCGGDFFSSNPSVSSELAFDGTRSLKHVFNGHQPGHINAGFTQGPMGSDEWGGCFTDVAFTAVDEVWITYQEYMVAGFLIDEIGTKAVKPGDEQHASHWWGYPNGPYPPGPPFNLGQGCCSTSIGRVLDFTCQECKPENTALGATWAAGNAINYYQNMNAFVMPDNKWVCYEHHLKYNDPGVANGFIEMFVTNMTDGLPTVQTMGHYNKEWRGARTTDPLPSTAKWALFREYVQDGKGTLYRDGHTVSTTRVGCGTAPPLDTTAPAKPTGLSVQ